MGQSRYVYQGAPLSQVIEDIEEQENYRFLYRDALISDKWVTIESSSETLISSLEAVLLPQRIEVKVDEKHRQILLSEAQTALKQKPAILRGIVVDQDTGVRLPFANITWFEQSRLRGAVTNEAGAFQLQIDPELTPQDEIALSISYIGYSTAQVTLDATHIPGELSIRLTPKPVQGQEVLIKSTILHTDLDTTWHRLLHTGLASPFGESSVIRSLQPLPAVALTTALSEGLNVRGSKADGFQVLLDGAPIYNQNHFFGMFDIFNQDALQTVGFFYDIAPASYFAPPGGTISFITRSGSLSEYKASVGASNTTLRATVEGPISRGKSSFLISGRHSYLDLVNWFNNEMLIGYGLDIDRAISELPEPTAEFNELMVRPGESSARFYDIHGKASRELRNGGNAVLSVYVGGNDTRLDATRLTIERNRDTELLEVVESPVSTLNRWGNEAASIRLNHRLGSRGYLQTLLSASHYLSRYGKDDFTYTRINPRNERPQNYIFPFSYRNELLDVQWAHDVNWVPNHAGIWTAGLSGHYYALKYNETSAIWPAFGENYYAMQFDAYGEYEYKESNMLHFRAGLRGHYFTQGSVLRLSPRAQVTMLPEYPASLRLGYSRNYQFLHNLFLENTNSASVWVMTTGTWGPTQVDNYTAGVYLRPTKTTFLQVEGYTRTYHNLRRHEINAPAQLASEDTSRFVPWFSDNSAFAKGVETMIRQRIGPFIWTNSYTLSRVDLQNDLLNDGERFPAEWDRRHQFTSHLEIELSNSLSTRFTWFYATGNPNVLSYADPEEPARLADYHRLDAGIQYTQDFAGIEIMARASVYNAYDHVNSWRRERIQILRRHRPEGNSAFFPVDIYDLGIQPSFDLSISF